VGLLVIDEFQHLDLAKGGGEKKMINFLVKLINTIGVSIVLIGTPKAMPIFAGEFRKARRSAGEGSVIWDRMPKDESWDDFVNELWQYQWLKSPLPIDEKIINTLYDLSQGILDIVIKLMCLAQARAILLGIEMVSVELLGQVYKDEFTTVHPMLEALRTNNKRKLIEYADLSMPDIDGKLLNSFDHLAVVTPTKTIKIDTGDAEENDKASSAVKLLVEMGVSEDIAAPLVSDALINNPDIPVIQIIHAATANLSNQKKADSERPKASKNIIKLKDWGQLPDGDLRNIYHLKTASMYESIFGEKLIYPLASIIKG
jgi:hypothetical protein